MQTKDKIINMFNHVFVHLLFKKKYSVLKVSIYVQTYKGVHLTIDLDLPCHTCMTSCLFFVAARLLSIKDINPADYINELDNFLLDVSVLSFLATLWVAFVFVISRHRYISSHRWLIYKMFNECLGQMLRISLKSCFELNQVL